jgi:hypothetical protein
MDTTGHEAATNSYIFDTTRNGSRRGDTCSASDAFPSLTLLSDMLSDVSLHCFVLGTLSRASRRVITDLLVAVRASLKLHHTERLEGRYSERGFNRIDRPFDESKIYLQSIFYTMHLTFVSQTAALLSQKHPNRAPGPTWVDRQIEEAFGVNDQKMSRIRKRFGEKGVEAAVHRRAQPPRPAARKLDGEQEAHMIAVLCHEKPEGREQWALRL